MVTGSSEVDPVFAVAGLQRDSEERKDPAQRGERQLPGASLGEGQVQAHLGLYRGQASRTPCTGAKLSAHLALSVPKAS